MRIGSFTLPDQLLIVAEIGNNHEGDIEVAETLVRQAADAGADAVKVQTFQTQYFVSAGDKRRYDRLKSFELSRVEVERLHRLAKSLGLLFLSTPLDLESAAFLEGLVDAYKIASGDNNFYPLMERICRTGKPIILSSGLSDLERIKASQQFIERQWHQEGIQQELVVLHCVSSYPVPPEQANVAAIPLLRSELGCPIGYSDHTVGIEACLAAVALGACLIEKHFTLDTQFSDFRDHQLSADPNEMTRLVQQAKRIRTMLGTPQKVVQPCEIGSSRSSRRSIVAAADLAQGHRLEQKDLTWIRPAVGLSPGEEDRLLGRCLKRAVFFGEPIQLSDVEG